MPERYNIAADVCDKHPRDQLAMVHEHSGCKGASRRHDVLGAKANGIDAIGVTYGYGTREELIAAGARQICDSPRAVLDVILGAPANTVSAVNPS